MRPDRREGGFTLFEVLIAFAIAALALAALGQGALGGLRATRVAGHTEEALSRARSRLAVVGAGAPLAAGSSSGDDGGGFRWRLRVAPALAAAATGQDARPVLFDVAVAISWTLDGGEREVVLATRRLGFAPPEPP